MTWFPVPQFAGRALVIGELEPGLWARPRGGLVGYLPLSDPARLADLTGINVIDAFPSRDLAQEGRGGPLSPLPDWLLLHHPSKTRVLIDLGPAVRVTYLPASRDAAVQRITSFVAGPGMRLVNRFARQLTADKQAFDLGGHWPCKASAIGELLDHWLADAELTNPDGFPRPRESLSDRPIRQKRPGKIGRPLVGPRPALYVGLSGGRDRLPLDCPAIARRTQDRRGDRHRRRAASWPADEEPGRTTGAAADLARVRPGPAATRRDGAIAATLAL